MVCEDLPVSIFLGLRAPGAENPKDLEERAHAQLGLESGEGRPTAPACGCLSTQRPLLRGFPLLFIGVSLHRWFGLRGDDSPGHTCTIAVSVNRALGIGSDRGESGWSLFNLELFLYRYPLQLSEISSCHCTYVWSCCYSDKAGNPHSPSGRLGNRLGVSAPPTCGACR